MFVYTLSKIVQFAVVLFVTWSTLRYDGASSIKKTSYFVIPLQPTPQGYWEFSCGPPYAICEENNCGALIKSLSNTSTMVGLQIVPSVDEAVGPGMTHVYIIRGWLFLLLAVVTTMFNLLAWFKIRSLLTSDGVEFGDKTLSDVMCYIFTGDCIFVSFFAVGYMQLMELRIWNIWILITCIIISACSLLSSVFGTIFYFQKLQSEYHDDAVATE